MKTPALHFQRICPLKALESASSAEVDIRKIAQLEQFVRDEIRNDSGVRLRLKKTIQLLLDSPNRRIIEGLEDQRRVFHSRKSPTRLHCKRRSTKNSCVDRRYERKSKKEHLPGKTVACVSAELGIHFRMIEQIMVKLEIPLANFHAACL